MTPARGAVAAGALFCALVAAGCGFGPGDSIGDVQLTVTRDYGSTVVLRRKARNVAESETVMRLLDRKAEISTRYGGGFVQSIEGVEGSSRGGPHDWFFYVNGVESAVGAADYELRADDRVWWDHRDWTAAMRVPAVVGSFPEPLRSGYDDERRPVELRCLAGRRACQISRIQLIAAGADLRPDAGVETSEPIRVLVGPWRTVRNDAAAALIEHGPDTSGVFVDFERRGGGWRLQPLDAAGRPRGPLLEAGLVAATRRGEDPPTWLVTGTDVRAITTAAWLLEEAGLRDRYAVAAPAGEPIPLPAR